jgi:microcystin degradation protein MlrC
MAASASSTTAQLRAAHRRRIHPAADLAPGRLGQPAAVPRLGIEPLEMKIIVARACIRRARRWSRSRQMIWVASPGVTTADLSTFTYQHRRRPLYPLEPQAQWP